MTFAQLIPWADSTSQRYDTAYPGGEMGGINKLLLHTTEGSGWPGYSGGASAPTLTMLPDFRTRTVQLRQHFPASMSARALANSGGLRTNRQQIFQIELCGTSGWASSENRSAPYRLADQWVSSEFPDWYLAEIARVWRWLHDEWGVPYMLPPQGFGGWASGARRFSNDSFVAYRGLLGHQHVPGNDHTDPGRINAGRILALAQGASASPKSPMVGSDWSDMASKAEIEQVVRKVVREELNRPFAGPWLATFGQGADGRPRLAMQAIRDMIGGRR